MSNIIVFDLDGVITSEEAYWDTAGLVVHELLYSPRYWNVGKSSAYVPVQSAAESRSTSRQVLPNDVIADFKARSVNSNWDTCYCGFCLYIITLLARLSDCSSLLPLHPEQADWCSSRPALYVRYFTLRKASPLGLRRDPNAEGPRRVPSRG